MTEIKDTSLDYNDMVDFKAKELITSDLSTFLGEQKEVKLNIKPKPIDPEFSEKWQSLYVNFRCEADYIEFMQKIGEVPSPNQNIVVYSKQKENGVLDFI